MHLMQSYFLCYGQPKWFAVAHSNVVGTGTLYFNDNILDTFYVGQSVTIANSGTSYNGSKTIHSSKRLFN
jgi:hypothetical protein